nr:PREDICTED: uncharacterized protein LOC103554526 isoform X2 [Equus przewalskii]
MLAEIVKHFYPRLVDLHNYIPTCNTDQKLSNWSVLSRQGGWAGRRQDCCAQASTGFLAPCLSWKVFHKLRLCISEVDIQKVVANTPGAIEPILCALREKVEDRTAHEDPPGSDSGPSWRALGTRRPQGAAAAGGEGAGSGSPAGVSQGRDSSNSRHGGHSRDGGDSRDSVDEGDDDGRAGWSPRASRQRAPAGTESCPGLLHCGVQDTQRPQRWGLQPVLWPSSSSPCGCQGISALNPPLPVDRPGAAVPSGELWGTSCGGRPENTGTIVGRGLRARTTEVGDMPCKQAGQKIGMINSHGL